jgi:hypothetical protein
MADSGSGADRGDRVDETRSIDGGTKLIGQLVGASTRDVDPGSCQEWRRTFQEGVENIGHRTGPGS